ncbi:MAG: hypothetical protein H7A46_20260 [Verrucomicrobiales bacterium]|nr:hypothetical protein [Verrucomicrobiales bacterium]
MRRTIAIVPRLVDDAPSCADRPWWEVDHSAGPARLDGRATELDEPILDAYASQNRSISLALQERVVRQVPND